MNKMKAASLMLSLVAFMSVSAVGPNFNYYLKYAQQRPGYCQDYDKFKDLIKKYPQQDLFKGGGISMGGAQATVGDCFGLSAYFNQLVKAGAFNLAAF